MRIEDQQVFEDAVAAIRKEGRYRVFADIMRERGRFPRARLRLPDGGFRDIVVWCSNDYLGQGQNPEVLDAAHARFGPCRRWRRRHPQHFRHHFLPCRS